MDRGDESLKEALRKENKEEKTKLKWKFKYIALKHWKGSAVVGEPQITASLYRFSSSYYFRFANTGAFQFEASENGLV